jgi:PAS domain S-box-containing protein
MEREVFFDGGTMITETDIQGMITYVNRKFIQMSAYAREELIGKPHSIIRHPDMPKTLFKDMWETLHRGEMWKGYVKNLRKDGAFYWVNVFVIPKFEDGKVVGYIAARKIPDRTMIPVFERYYADLLEAEKLHEVSANRMLSILGDQHSHASPFQ